MAIKEMSLEEKYDKLLEEHIEKRVQPSTFQTEKACGS